MAKTVRKYQSSFYRRLFVAHLIDSGVNTVPKIIANTGMPRRTIQDTLSALSDLGVTLKYIGPTKSGFYQINDWGPIQKCWIQENLEHIKDVLEL